MKKEFFTREAKLGLVAVATIVVLYFGIKFLKGINVFSPTQYYYGVFDDVNGLIESAPVYIQGYKVGMVDEISYDFAASTPFTIRISVNKDLQFPLGTKMELADDGLLGDKMIRIIFPEDRTGQLHVSKDTLETETAKSMFADAAAMIPTLHATLEHVDSLVCVAQTLVSGKELQNTLASVEKTATNLATSSSELKHLMNQNIPQLLTDVQLAVNDLKHVGDNLKQIDFQATFGKVDGTLNDLQTLTSKLNDTNGTLGLLMNDKELYLNLSNTLSSADKLLIDLQKNPKRYVHFSLFGNKNKE